MTLALRFFVLLAVVGVYFSLPESTPIQGGDSSRGGKKMYGLIGKMRAVEGKRDALIGILLQGVNEMPGCLSYIVAKDPADADTIWVTEVWDDKASHKASLALPPVREAITKGK